MRRSRVIVWLLVSILIAGGCGNAAFAREDDSLEEVVVTARLRPQSVEAVAASLTVLPRATIAAASTQHLQDLLPLVPNLHMASGTSRPRYFQLRGVGETEQWQGAPNSSVGFLIDDIDFSGVGMPAGSFDLAQVEVLRGPQGTSFGANALAGLIALRSAEPQSDFESRVELSGGEFGSGSVAGLIGGALADSVSGRFSLQRYRSDGFRRNVTLGRDDTNGYDEWYLRGKMRAEFGSDTALRLTALWADLDNGYDAFALDNSRVTRSDKPGRDAQRSLGLAAVLDTRTTGGRRWRSTTAHADSDLLYSFDGDWTAASDYDFAASLARGHRVTTQDLRWWSADDEECRACWVLGVYGRRLRETLQQLDLFGGDIYRQLASDFTATNLAAYGQLDWRLTPDWQLTTGLRIERRRARYDDS
ncbi:MAG: TonB-dependent receptor plug domain-containing protein, partial [Steroidobacteraceae bacterium]|nr:TonB-dependent receptor plug domain-containing protein [Steroidobacteraceae bacterium]